MCANKDYLTAGERRQAIDYLKQWHFSLAQAKKNVADLQLMMANRVLGVTVPVLGVVFDINDLSIMAGVTFTILLSWFHFSLRRQHDNVKKVFELAGELDSKSKPNNSSNLKMAYDLLAMTQVLTIPPGASAGSRNLSLQRRLLRLPNLIMWTAVVAQAIVLTDDIVTMKHGDDLGVIVSHAETAIASLLLAYMTYRTIQCFRLMSETYSEWLSAYQKVYGAETRQADLSEQGRGKLAWLLLAAVLCVHLLGERPDAWTTFNETLSAFLTPLGRFFSQVSRIEEWLSIWLIVPLMAVLFWSSFIKRVRRVRLIALFLAGVVLLDAGHTLLRYLNQD